MKLTYHLFMNIKQKCNNGKLESFLNKKIDALKQVGIIMTKEELLELFRHNK